VSDFTGRQALLAAKNPPGIHLGLRVKGGRTRFHIGEVIPLEAAFSDSAPGGYRVNIDPGNRDLPWSSDAFVVDLPAEAPDPLAPLYDGSHGMGYDGPGPQWRELSGAPVAVSLDLNQWRRFDRPGIYRLYLTCARIASRKRDEHGIALDGPPVTSDILQIEILPDDPAWAVQTLQQALPLFTEARSANNQEARMAASRVLRFLGTPEAERAILNRYATLSQFDFWNSRVYYEGRLGLFGSGHRDVVAQAMQAKIDDPDFPIAEYFLYDLAQLQTLIAYSEPMPPYPQADPAKAVIWRKTVAARQAAQQAFLQAARAHLQQVIGAKRGLAHARSLMTLAEPYSASRESRQRRQAVAADLVAAFDELPSDQQSALLQDTAWPEIRTPRLLPAIRRLYESPTATESTYTAEEQRGLALRRLLDLVPVEGRHLLLTEIQRPHLRLPVEILMALPDTRLPQLDSALVTNLENDRDDNEIGKIAVLIQRYASSSIVDRVRAVYETSPGRWACAIQAPLLAYLLRADPGYGAAAVRKALAARQETGCYRTLLSDIAAPSGAASPYLPPALQTIAIEALDDPDPAVRSDAAKTLGAHGSPAAEAVLWQHLRKWVRTHREAQKAAYLSSDTPEGSIAQALATAPAWLIDRRQMAELRRLCDIVVPPGAMERSGAPQIYADTTTAHGKQESWRVEQYQMTSRTALKDKLAQFPRGTTFRLMVDPTWSADRQNAALFTDLTTFLQKRGMHLRCAALR